MKGFVDFRFDNDENWLIVKNIPISRLQCKTIPYLRPKWLKSAKIDTLFMTRMAEKPYPLGLHIPIYCTSLSPFDFCVTLAHLHNNKTVQLQAVLAVVEEKVWSVSQWMGGKCC